MWLSRGGKGGEEEENSPKASFRFKSHLLPFFFFLILDNFYKVEGAKDALICGNSSDAG